VATATKAPEFGDVRAGQKASAWRRRLPLMPALIFLIVVTQIPFVVTIVISLFHWVVMYPNDTRFDWFANYAAVLRDAHLRAAIVNTVIMVVIGVLSALIIGTFLALLLNRSFRGRGIVRTLLITPFLIMPMAGSLMWKHLIYNPEYGLINGVLKWLGNTFGFDPAQPEWVSGSPKAAVIIVLVWTWTPFMMLITLAGLQAQDSEVKEAAMIDGANAFQQFRYLTFKHLRQYLELATVLGVIYLLNAYDQVFSITQGGPGTATTNLPYQIYITIFRGYDYGRGAAAGVLVVIFSIIISNFGLRLISSLNDVVPAGGRKK
jgi:sorbitol/mannitol transport system permease protein